MEKMVSMDQLQHFYKSKKIFLTGHTGFKGSWLGAWLHLLGATVKGYALAPENDQCLFNYVQDSFEESVIADIREKERLKNEIVSFQPDFIFHLAAQPLVRRSYRHPSETFEVNAVGTANVLEAAGSLSKKCTIIVITTDKVYENIEQDVLYKETDVLGGYDPYSASKACTEIVANSFRSSFFNPAAYESHHKALSTARAGNVIGGGDFSEDRIIPDIIRSLSSNINIEVRNPASVRPWQHVLEPLGGYLLLGGLLSNDHQKYSGAFNFGPNPEDHLTVGDLVQRAIGIWGEGAWTDTSANTHPHEAGLLKLDISKAKAVLNWNPKLNAAQAVAWTIDWYRQPKQEIRKYTIDQINNFMSI
jgi:CDP-glucose 4,6-dehydratase